MKFLKPVSIEKIAASYNCKIIGDPLRMATGINEIHRVKDGDIIFVDNPKYYKTSLASAASFIIIDQEIEVPADKVLLVCDNPFEVYNAIVSAYRIFSPIEESDFSGVHPSCHIEPNVTIGKHVTIGKNCYIQSQVYIGDYTVIGDNVSIHANTSIGTDAFYYKKENKQYKKWISGGRVVIEDNVEIAAGCTINKGVSSDTLIGAGTKIDCQVHIGHGVLIGKNCLIVAQSGVAGKCNIEDEVTIYGQVAIAPNLTIGKGAVILAQSGVTKNCEPGKVYFGYPASESREKLKELALLRKLAREK